MLAIAVSVEDEHGISVKRAQIYHIAFRIAYRSIARVPRKRYPKTTDQSSRRHRYGACLRTADLK